MKTNNIKGLFIKYVSLNVTGMVGLSCYILADTFFIAQGIGASGLTALNLVLPVYSIINGFGLMLGMGGATRFAISKSAKAFTVSMLLAAFASIVFLGTGMFFAGPIASALGANTETLQLASVYLKTIMLFSPIFILNNIVICFVRNDGSPRLSMLAMLIGSLSNIVLDYIFIFLLKMGMFGAAFATGAAPIISLLILSLHFIMKRHTFYLLKKLPDAKQCADIIRLGLSAFITELSSGIVIVVFNFIILGIAGNVGVAAYGVIANIALIVIAVFTGVAQGIQPIISRFYGENKIENVYKILKYGIITAVSLAVIIYVCAFIFTQPIVSFFNKDNNLQLAQIAISGIRIYFTCFAFAGVNILCAAYFAAVAKAKNAFTVSILRGFGVIVPAAFIFSALMGIDGVWISMTAAEGIVFAITIFMLTRSKLKKV